MNKAVVVFGTFNPLTKAHIHIGQLAKDALGATRVIYVPAKDSFLNDWKLLQKDSVLSSDIRVQLMKQAFEPYGFEVSECEVKGISDGKTYHTMRQLKEENPDTQFTLVMGIDKIPELHRWYKAEELMSENHFIIINREHHSLEDVISSSEMVMRYQDHFTSLHNDDYAELSSTDIREACATHHVSSIQEYLPEVVYQYLLDHPSLYTKGDNNHA